MTVWAVTSHVSGGEALDFEFLFGHFSTFFRKTLEKKLEGDTIQTHQKFFIFIGAQVSMSRRSQTSGVLSGGCNRWQLE